MKKIILALVLLGLLGAGIGTYMFNQTVESTKSKKVDYTLSAAEFVSLYESNEEEANSKYLDKVIAVKGTVEKLEKKEDKITVYLDADNPMSNVIFQLEDSNSEIKEGEEVTLKGMCTGYLMDIVLVRGVRI